MEAAVIRGSYRPAWDEEGRCFILIWWQDGKQAIVRAPEADRDADPADWWKRV